MFRQSKSQPEFRLVTSLDGINGRSIQTLMRGENDSKQSDEIKAKYTMMTIFRFHIRNLCDWREFTITAGYDWILPPIYFV